MTESCSRRALLTGSVGCAGYLLTSLAAAPASARARFAGAQYGAVVAELGVAQPKIFVLTLCEVAGKGDGRALAGELAGLFWCEHRRIPPCMWVSPLKVGVNRNALNQEPVNQSKAA